MVGGAVWGAATTPGARYSPEEEIADEKSREARQAEIEQQREIAAGRKARHAEIEQQREIAAEKGRMARQTAREQQRAFVELNRVLLDRVKQFARESGLGELPELEGQGPRSPDDQPQYRGKQDYVLEITPTERTVTITGSQDSPLYALGFSARGRLVRVADNTVVHTYTATQEIEGKNPDAWAAENGKLLVQELGRAVQEIAKIAVDQWLRPAVGGEKIAVSTIVILRPSGGDSSISIDGCLIGSVGRIHTFKMSPGKHVIKSETGSIIGETKIELKPGETRYLWIFGTRRAVLEEVSREFAEQTIQLYRFPIALPLPGRPDEH